MVEPPPRTRLYCDQTLALDHCVRLGQMLAHRLRSVLRLAVGDRLRLFNADCGEWLCELTALDKKQATVAPISLLRPAQQPSDALWLLFAPLKKDAMDVLVEKSVELGVDRLLPTATQHTDVSRVNVERLTAQAVAAAEQCERPTVPTVEPPKSLRDRLSGWPSDRVLIICAEAGSAEPIADLAGRFAGRPAGIMIGPEGGLAKSELDALAKLPFAHAAGLGPRILRAETAAIAALAIWQTMGGVDKERPPFR